MKNSEKGKFESAWQKAFENAEQAPSEKVWTGVEQNLDKTLTVQMKRSIVFYQRLAAAAIVFALLLGGLSTYFITGLRNRQELDMAQNKLTTPDASALQDNENKQHSVGTVQSAADSREEKANSDNETERVNRLIATGESVDEADPISIISQQIGDSRTSVIRKQAMDHSINGQRSVSSLLQEPSATVSGKIRVVEIIRRLPAMPSSFMSSENDRRTAGTVWASLGASSGNYTPSAGFSSSASSRAYQSPTGMNNIQNAYSTTSSRGTAFSVGMNVAKKVSRRWLMQGGVSYLNQAIGYTSNYAALDANNKVMATVADYSNLNSSIIAVASPYEINSVNEFVSVPLQAGYLLVDKKFGLQLNSGISTDFFIRNTLTDKSGQLASYSSGAGEDSPYRSVSWAGLASTELSYKIATHYRISIAPGLRYSINSVLKSDVITSNPLVWDIGFRFRYIFR